MCELKDFSHLQLDEWHFQMLKDELELWHDKYLPIGKTVLDAGAGNGETAQFYLNHGAQKVICIEPNADLLKHNFSNDPRVIIIDLAIDSVKIDIEGSEINMIVETHGLSKFKRIYEFPYGGHSIWKILRIRLALRNKLHLWRMQNG